METSKNEFLREDGSFDKSKFKNSFSMLIEHIKKTQHEFDYARYGKNKYLNNDNTLNVEEIVNDITDSVRCSVEEILNQI